MITLCTPKLLKKYIVLFSSTLRMSGKNMNFGDKKLKKVVFTETKKVIKIDDINISKMLVSKQEPYGTKNSFKYFIGYNDDDVMRPL